MDSEKIESLLSKYWAGETSLDDEQALREYFGRTDHEVPAQWQAAAALFRYFESQRAQNMDNGVPPFTPPALHAQPRKKTVSRWLRNTMRIAAGIIVLFVAVYMVRNEIRNTSPAEVTDTYDDPELAFEETKKALLMISKSFGTAEDQARKINLFNEAQQTIKTQDRSAQ